MAWIAKVGVCPLCGEAFDIKEMQADNIIAGVKGGKITLASMQVLCNECNNTKSDM